MTASRVTAKQAVEYLKIHQLRKENAAIYQSVQVLREEVSALHKNNDSAQKAASKTAESIKRLENSHTAQTEVTEDLKTQFVAISNENHTTRNLAEHLKTSLKKTEDAQKTLSARLEEINTNSEKCSANLEVSFKHNSRSLEENIASLEFQLLNKASTTDTAALQERIKALEDSTQTFQQRNRSVSRVHDSIEGRHKHGHVGGTSVGTQTLSEAGSSEEHVQKSPQMQISSTEGGEMMLSVEEPIETLMYDAAEVLDRGQNSREISYLDHGINVNARGDSMTMLPPPQPNAIPVVDCLLSLRQQPFEKASDYLTKSHSIIENLPNGFEDVFLTRFVEGLSDVQQQEQMRRWLDTSAWSVANAKDYIHLSEYKSKHIQIPDTHDVAVRAEVLPHRADVIGHERVELIQANRGQSNEQRSTPPRLELRRSQRLAALKMRHNDDERDNEKMKATNKRRAKNAKPNSGADNKGPSATLRDSKRRFRAQRTAGRAQVAS